MGLVVSPNPAGINCIKTLHTVGKVLLDRRKCVIVGDVDTKWNSVVVVGIIGAEVVGSTFRSTSGSIQTLGEE